MNNNTPYKGLMPYLEEDADYFFGRNSECEIIISNLMASRLTLLYGPSGVGKSSVLSAGVVHQLKETALKSSNNGHAPEFAVVEFKSWRDDPMIGLTAAIREAVPVALGDDASSFVEILRDEKKQLGCELFIILDQFEEYFLYHPEEEGDGTFSVEFPRAVKSADLCVSFLISIREDALAKLDRFKGRIPQLFSNYLRIQHLDRDQARDAIINPINKYNTLKGEDISIEDELVKEVLNNVQAEKIGFGEIGKGAVQNKVETEGSSSSKATPRIEAPFLQLVMTRLWNEEMKADSTVLRRSTLVDESKLGGIDKIVRTHLDEVMSQLSETDQGVAARFFKYLVTPSGGKIAYTPVNLAYFAGLPSEQVKSVVDKLAGREFLILHSVEPSPNEPETPRFEIFHDVLAKAVLDWRARYAQKLELNKKRSIFRWAIGVAILVLIIGGAFAYRQYETAKVLRDRTDSQKLAALASEQLLTDPQLSLQLAVKAVEKDSTGKEAEASLRAALADSLVNTLTGHTGAVYFAAYSSDGKFIATASADTTARIWDGATGKIVTSLFGNDAAVVSAEFSRDNKLLLTASLDGKARVWDVTSGKVKMELIVNTKYHYVNSAAFSPDGNLIVTAGNDRTAHIWDSHTGQLLKPMMTHNGPLLSAAFSPDGKHIVTASFDQTARIWDAETGKETRRFPHPQTVSSAKYSPDGLYILTACFDNVARIWDANSEVKSSREFSGHTGAIRDASFSADGKTIITASFDGTTRVWDADNRQVLHTLRGHKGQVYSASFSPDGRFVITASDDKTARIYEIDSLRQFKILGDRDFSAGKLAFIPGKLIALAGADGETQIRQISDNRLLRKFSVDNVLINGASISPNGRYLITARADGTAIIWDIASNEMPKSVRIGPLYADDADFGKEGHLRGTKKEHSVMSAVFSHTGKYIATASLDGIARILDANTDQVLQEFKGGTTYISEEDASLDRKSGTPINQGIGAKAFQTLAPNYSVAFSPDDKYVVVGSADKTARIWETVNGSLRQELKGHTDKVVSVDYSPDGKFIVTASADRTARLWNSNTGESLFVLKGHTGSLNSAVFSPNGKYILTSADDQTARVWDVSTGQTLFELPDQNAAVISAVFSADGSFIATASKDNKVRVYHCDDLNLTSRDLLDRALKSIRRTLTPDERRLYRLEE